MGQEALEALRRSDTENNKNMSFKEPVKNLGSRDGKKSVESRFKGKTKEGISEMMGKVGAGKPLTEKKREKIIRKIAKLFGDAIREDGDPHSPYGDGWD